MASSFVYPIWAFNYMDGCNRRGSLIIVGIYRYPDLISPTLCKGYSCYSEFVCASAREMATININISGVYLVCLIIILYWTGCHGPTSARVISGKLSFLFLFWDGIYLLHLVSFNLYNGRKHWHRNQDVDVVDLM